MELNILSLPFHHKGMTSALSITEGVKKFNFEAEQPDAKYQLPVTLTHLEDLFFLLNTVCSFTIITYWWVICVIRSTEGELATRAIPLQR